MSSLYFPSWCYLRKWGCMLSPRFHHEFFEFGVNQENCEAVRSEIPLCNPSGGKLLLRPFSSYSYLLGWVAFRILQKFMSSSGKITNCFSTLTIFAENLPRRCSTGLRMCLWLKVLLMWSFGGLQAVVAVK